MLSDHEKYHPPVTHLSFKLSRNYSQKELLKFLQEEISKNSLIENILSHEGLFINRKRMGQNYLPSHFKKDDEIELYYFLREPQDIQLQTKNILWEGNGIIAIQKPAWLPTQGSRASLRFSLEEKARKLTGLKYLNALHRLDRQTSGIVLFATNLDAERHYMKLFHDQQIKKTYLAYVSQKPKNVEWEIKGYLKKDFRKLPLNIYKLFEKEQNNSRYSHSSFQIHNENSDAILIKAFPHTGRTHQIRVHLSYSGCPIIGDDLYGGRRKLSSRILLHALKLQFLYKEKNSSKLLELEAPIPEDFKLVENRNSEIEIG